MNSFQTFTEVSKYSSRALWFMAIPVLSALHIASTMLCELPVWALDRFGSQRTASDPTIGTPILAAYAEVRFNDSLKLTCRQMSMDAMRSKISSCSSHLWKITLFPVDSTTARTDFLTALTS